MQKPTESVHSIAEKVQAYLEFLSGLGVKGFDCSAQTLETLESWGQNPLKTSGGLADIAEELKQCRKCSLGESGCQAIMGAGKPGARVMFIGGWPEAGEKTSGKPYSGAAGELLARIVQAMALTPEEVYITHVLKCRPSENTPPQARDVRICCGFVQREIDIVGPAVICALGGTAAKALLGLSAPWTEIRGRFHDYRSIPVMPTFSPEYLLVNPSAKRQTWADIKQMLQKIKEG